jgi:hypothetical protein
MEFGRLKTGIEPISETSCISDVLQTVGGVQILRVFCLFPPIFSLTYFQTPHSYSRLSIDAMFRVSEKEKSVFWEFVVSAILSANMYSTCVLF